MLLLLFFVHLRPNAHARVVAGIIAMDGNNTTIIGALLEVFPPAWHTPGLTPTPSDPAGQREPKNFTFDHSYWSHDGFKAGPDGLITATSSAYATQHKVFDDLGQGVVQNAFEGYNAALFAYGQTGSGKSYSMLGYGANVGIVPIACNEIFRRIEANKDPNHEYQVTYSMLEIYNERVRDLLSAANPPGGLKLREHQKSGFFVHGLREGGGVVMMVFFF